jgi:hypothetical protein
MKRTLISYDVFESIRNDSLSFAGFELEEAAPYLSRVLEEEALGLNVFGAETVLYESIDGNLIHANYKIEDGHIVFENIEQLSIDTDSEATKGREVLSNLVDALLEDEGNKADNLFADYMALPHVSRNLNEIKFKTSVTTGRGRKSSRRGKKRAGGSSAINKGKVTKRKNKRKIGPGARKVMDRAMDVAKRKLGGRSQRTGKGQRHVRATLRIAEDQLQNLANLTENVFDYVDYQYTGPVVRESAVMHDDNGNIVAVKIPTHDTRNENNLQSFDWDVSGKFSDVNVLRSKGRKLHEDDEFCKAVAELKRQNALSDNEALEEALESVVSQWPAVLYLTQAELSETIKNALDVVGATNFDDQSCEFMSEGVLRTAHSAYVDRVSRILTSAGVRVDEDVEDKYNVFKTTVDNFYPHLDETNVIEMQVFVDLYESLRQIYALAERQEEGEAMAETAAHLNELGAIIQNEVEPSLDVAQDAAEWLNHIIETNLGTKGWGASGVHVSVTGEHPDMAEKAAKSYAPASDGSGNFNDPAPVSDGDWKLGKGGDGAREMRGRSWGNSGGGDVFPSLKNPYVPKPFGGYTMKGEDGNHDDADGEWSSNDTWPSLQNPYVPKAVKQADLVVDK